MNRSCKTLLFLFCTLAASATIAGCADDDDDSADTGGEAGDGSGGNVAQAGNGGAVEMTGGGDAGAGGAGPVLECTQLKYGAGVPAHYVTEAQPAAEGGEISAGTYQLTALTHYGSEEASVGNDIIHSAVKLTGNTLEWANQGKDEPETRGSFSYTIDDTDLTLTKVCPSAGDSQATPYTATDTTFIIYLDAEYTYTKQQ